MNYNGYGANLDELFYSPVELYKIAAKYASPFEFIQREHKILSNGYRDVIAKQYKPSHGSEAAAMFILANEKWARRASGIVGNELAKQFPYRAHAILTEREERIVGASGEEEPTSQVSIRAPKNNPVGAGGRKGASELDVLTYSLIKLFSTEFRVFMKVSK